MEPIRFGKFCQGFAPIIGCTPFQIGKLSYARIQKQKVHSLVDKVYSRENLKLAWEHVRANRGAGGADGITIEAFEANLDANLERLHQELRDKTYQPQPVRRLEIPKKRYSRKDEATGHTIGLRPGVSAGTGQSPGDDL